MELKFRKFQNNDIAEIINLYKLCFGQKTNNKFIQNVIQGNLDILNWKYSNPDSSRFIAEIDGNVIGHHGVLNHKMSFNSEMINVAEYTDFMVHPKFGHKGIGTKLNQEHEKILQKDNDLLFTFPNEINQNRIKTKDNTKILLTPISQIEKKLKSNIQSYKYSSIKSIYSFHNQIDIIYKHFSNNNTNIYYIRNDDCLNLRFVKNPVYNYKMILNEEKNILNGYAILKIFTNNETSEKTGHIVDLLTTNCYAAENLLKYSENYFFINDVNKITSYCNSNNLNYKTFENLGYKLSKKQPVLRIKKLSDKKIKLDLDSINNLLDITMLNHDVY